eukprot:1160218-Pelagomonas_calceolata.AAC.1
MPPSQEADLYITQAIHCEHSQARAGLESRSRNLLKSGKKAHRNCSKSRSFAARQLRPICCKSKHSSRLLWHYQAGPSMLMSHNGMEIYTDDKDFVTAQLVSTRNINPGLLVDWICGGLNYQIE